MKSIAFLLVMLALAGCNGSQEASKAPVSATAPQKPPVVQPATLDPTKVAFIGDSITEHWTSLAVHLSNYVNAGVSGNTTPMMLARFGGVISNAQTVVILAGVNDIRTIPDANTNDLLSMALQASDAGRTVIVCELLPVSDWHPPVVLTSDAVGQADIEQWNIQVHWMAGAYGWKVAAYNAPMALNGAQNTALFLDGLHPNQDGYAVMEGILAPLLPAEAGWH